MGTFTISKKKIFEVQEHLNKLTDDYGKKYNCKWQKRKSNETLDKFVSKMSTYDKYSHLMLWTKISTFDSFLENLAQLPPFEYSPMIYEHEYLDRVYEIEDDAIIEYCNTYNSAYNVVSDIKDHPERYSSEFGGDLKGYSFMFKAQMYFMKIIMKDVGLKATFDKEDRIINIKYDD